MLYNRKFIHLQCVFHSIRLRLRLTKIGCRETINFFFAYSLFHIVWYPLYFTTVINTPNYFLTPPSLRATSPIFRCYKTQGRSLNNPLFIVRCTYIVMWHPVRLRDTAGGEYETRLLLLLFLTSSSFQPPRPAGTPPIFPNGNTGGEDWKWRFSFGIRIHCALLPYVLHCKT